MAKSCSEVVAVENHVVCVSRGSVDGLAHRSFYISLTEPTFGRGLVFRFPVSVSTPHTGASLFLLLRTFGVGSRQCIPPLIITGSYCNVYFPLNLKCQLRIITHSKYIQCQGLRCNLQAARILAVPEARFHPGGWP